jgi:hypothetical protein
VNRARGPDLTSALSDSYPLYPRASTSPQRPGLPSSPQELASGKVAELAEAVLGLKERINTLDEELEKRFFARSEALILTSLPGMGPILGPSSFWWPRVRSSPLKVLRSSPPTQVLSRRPLCSHGRLTDEEWARLQPLLPENGTAVGNGEHRTILAREITDSMIGVEVAL